MPRLEQAFRRYILVQVIYYHLGGGTACHEYTESRLRLHVAASQLIG